MYAPSRDTGVDHLEAPTVERLQRAPGSTDEEVLIPCQSSTVGDGIADEHDAEDVGVLRHGEVGAAQPCVVDPEPVAARSDRLVRAHQVSIARVLVDDWDIGEVPESQEALQGDEDK